MVRRLVIGLLVLGGLVAAAPAAAHSIARKEAVSTAWLKADDWAQSKEWRWGDVTDITVTRSRCHRPSRHIWKCWASVEFEEWNYDYSWSNRTYCQIDIKIRLANRSWETRERVTKTNCF